VPRTAAVVIAAALLGGAGLVAASAPSRQPVPPPPAPIQSDLDAFMQKVLARRDDNWKKLQQYILTEKDLIEITGLGHLPIWGEKREYSWFLKDGFFVRSPTKVNGVTISDADRRKYEADYLKRAKERDAARTAGAPRDVESLIKQSREPEFISSAYFLRFKFEQGKYALVGTETFEGRDMLRVEYYPARLFSHEQDRQQQRTQQGKTDRQKDMDSAIEAAMNKVSLVTLWVEPKAFQIVKYTFDNVSLDFLPGAAFLRMNDLRVSMTMGQPYPGVWLPRDMELNAGAMLAVGQIDMRYRLEYTDYKLAETSTRIIKRDGGARR
jgi:hypothetical protein